MVKEKNNSKTAKWFITMMMLAVMFAAVGCPESDGGYSISISNLPTVGDIDFTATIEDKMAVRLAWKPLADASAYQIYRDEIWLATVDSGKDTYTYDYVSFGEFKDGQTYTYCIVAQSGNNGVMGKSKSVTVKAEFEPQGKQVAAVTDVTTCLIDDEYFVSFDKPDYLIADVRIGSKISGADSYADDLFGVFSTGMSSVIDGKTYSASVPSVAGTFEYRITTSYATNYYTDNVTTDTVTVPSAGETLPRISTQSTEDGVKVTFNDTVGATYTLYRAEQNDNAAQAFTKLNITPVTVKCSTPDQTSYTYLDTTAELGKTYCYFLAGKLGSNALEFNENAMANVTYSDNSWIDNWYSNISFAAYNNNGSDATVDLSWTYDDSITYTLTRCLINSTDGIHTEETIDISGATLSNGVKRMKDKITKTDSNTSYKYTLTVKKGDSKHPISRFVSYAKTRSDVSFSGLNRYEIYYPSYYSDNSVDLTISASSDIDVTSDVKCYRATAVYDSNSSFKAEDRPYNDFYYSLTSDWKELRLGTDLKHVSINKYRDTSAKKSGSYVYMIKCSKEGYEYECTKKVYIP